MYRKEYYCLVAGLPDLFFNENKPGINRIAFFRELKLHLSREDSSLIELLRLPFDNENFLNIYFKRKRPFNCLGTITKKYFEHQLLRTTETRQLPEYMLQFLHRIDERESKEVTPEVENILNTLFYEYVFKTKNDFLKNWFEFELNVKNTITALNCSRFNYDLTTQLIQANKGSEVTYLLKNKRLSVELFEDLIPFNYDIFRVAGSNAPMLEKEKELDQIKWNYLDDNTCFHYFTIEKILAYTIKLLMIERWMKLQKETGTILLGELINELKTSYKFPVEFSL